MRAIVIDQGEDKKNTASLKQIDAPALKEGMVRIAVDYSSMNYKDALVLLGTPGIVRNFPMVAGIDCAGKVVESTSANYKEGDMAVVTGWGLCEDKWGGYAEEVCVEDKFVCHIPKGRDALWAMRLGTAGFTAMMAVMALERDGALNNIDAPVVVTGAAGGVGGLSLVILSALGKKACALSGRAELTDYLKGLGADTVIGRDDARSARLPMDKELWSGIIDNVGGDILAGLLAQVHYGGAAALCGLAADAQYQGSVMPYILRGISVYGIESVYYPEKAAIWERLDQLVDDKKLDSMTAETVSLEQALEYAPQLLAGKIRGRLLVTPK